MEFQEKYGKFMSRVRSDPELRARMLAAPAGVLAEHGIGVPPGVELRVVEDTAAVRHVPLPPSPNAVVPDAGAEAVAGGVGHMLEIGGSLSPRPAAMPPPLFGGYLTEG